MESDGEDVRSCTHLARHGLQTNVIDESERESESESESESEGERKSEVK